MIVRPKLVGEIYKKYKWHAVYMCALIVVCDKLLSKYFVRKRIKTLIFNVKQEDFKWFTVVFMNISHWTLHWHILILLSFARLRLPLLSSDQHYAQVFISPAKHRFSDSIRGNMRWKDTSWLCNLFSPLLHPLVCIFTSICSVVLSMLPFSLLKSETPHP
jgi:hypothetical protein